MPAAERKKFHSALGLCVGGKFLHPSSFSVFFTYWNTTKKCADLDQSHVTWQISLWLHSPVQISQPLTVLPCPVIGKGGRPLLPQNVLLSNSLTHSSRAVSLIPVDLCRYHQSKMLQSLFGETVLAVLSRKICHCLLTCKDPRISGDLFSPLWYPNLWMLKTLHATFTYLSMISSLSLNLVQYLMQWKGYANTCSIVLCVTCTHSLEMHFSKHFSPGMVEIMDCKSHQKSKGWPFFA